MELNECIIIAHIGSKALTLFPTLDNPGALEGGE